MRRDLASFGDHLVHRLDDGAAADRQRARAISAHPVGDFGGVAVDDLDRLERHAEMVGDELREGRLVPLTVRVRPGQHCNAAGRVHADRRQLEQPGAGAQ